MKRVYSVDLNSHIWYPGNYKADWHVKIDTANKQLTEYLEEKVLAAIEEYIEKEGVF